MSRNEIDQAWVEAHEDGYSWELLEDLHSSGVNFGRLVGVARIGVSADLVEKLHERHPGWVTALLRWLARSAPLPVLGGPAAAGGTGRVDDQLVAERAAEYVAATRSEVQAEMASYSPSEPVLADIGAMDPSERRRYRKMRDAGATHAEGRLLVRYVDERDDSIEEADLLAAHRGGVGDLKMSEYVRLRKHVEHHVAVALIGVCVEQRASVALERFLKMGGTFEDLDDVLYAGCDLSTYCERRMRAAQAAHALAPGEAHRLALALDGVEVAAAARALDASHGSSHAGHAAVDEDDFSELERDYDGTPVPSWFDPDE